MLATLFRFGAVLLASCSALCAQSYQWTAYSGRPPQPGIVDGPLRDARFYVPWGITATSAGLIFISDATADCIRIVLPDNTVGVLAGSTLRGGVDGPAQTARFASPAGLAFANGALYVADRGNHAIRRVSSTGAVTTFAGRLGVPGGVDGAGSDARFREPTGLCADREGNLYVADSGNSTIRKIAPDGAVSTIAGTLGFVGSANGVGPAARFDFPMGIASDWNGNLYVADTYNQTIRRIVVADGSVSTLAGSPGLPGAVNGSGATARFSYPQGILAYADGSILVCDTGNECIRLITTAGAVSTHAGRLNVQGSQDGPRASARFFSPIGLCFGPGGVYVTDTANFSIRKIADPDYEVSTFAGPGGNFGRRDGVGPEALYNYPNGVAVHSSGDLYVADSRGNTIRRISPDRNAVTLVTGGEDLHVDGPPEVARVNYPYGIAVAADRTVYFCEQQRHTIRKLSPDGVLTTIAGFPGLAGALDGEGTAARFNFPSGIALDREGNLYIADRGSSTIRRIAAGTTTVTTFAGASGLVGSADGTGTSARFRYADGVATDAEGNVYVADTSNHTIRRITPAGVVTTIAGQPGVPGATDGASASARFYYPVALSVTSAGDLVIADYTNQTVRLLSRNVVSTIGGDVLRPSYSDGVGNRAWFFAPSGIATDASGNIYLTDSGNNLVRRGELLRRPVITTQPRSLSVLTGDSVTLTVAATGGALTYQWYFEDRVISGATSSTYTIANISSATAGRYTVRVSNVVGPSTSDAANVTIALGAEPGRIINLSILTSLAAPGDSYTMGFVVGGRGTSGRKPLVIRAAGPSLARFGVAGTLDDPRLELFSGATAAGSNDNWGGSSALATAMRAVGAFDYTGPSSADAALAADFDSGNNSARVSASGPGTGAVISEIYDATPASALTPATPRLINVSVLKHLGSGLTAGFALGGRTARTVLIRAIGPTLAVPPFNVGGVVADPQFELYSGSTKIGENNDWGGSPALFTTFTQVGAFPLPAASKDAVLQVTLPPGSYTVQVTGVGGASGTALIEVYEVP